LAIPDDSFCTTNDRSKFLDCLWADVKTFLIRWHRSVCDDSAWRVVAEGTGNHDINRKNQLLVSEEASTVWERIAIKERLADFTTSGFVECVRHPATNNQRVYLWEERIDDLDFVLDFGPAKNGNKWPCGCCKRTAEVCDFFVHQEAGNARLPLRAQDGRNTFGGCVCAVRCTKRIVDVNIGERCKLCRQVSIIGFLSRRKSCVFQE
jgi:hypothetical protein